MLEPAARQQRHRVPGDAEIGRVPERRQTAVAEDQVEAHGEDRQDQHLREQAEVIRAERARDESQRERGPR